MTPAHSWSILFHLLVTICNYQSLFGTFLLSSWIFVNFFFCSLVPDDVLMMIWQKMHSCDRNFNQMILNAWEKKHPKQFHTELETRLRAGKKISVFCCDIGAVGEAGEANAGSLSFLTSRIRRALRKKLRDFLGIYHIWGGGALLKSQNFCTFTK